MEDTIAAVATAHGEGGIGIIRISGDKSLDILKEIFIENIEKKDKSYIGDIQFEPKTLKYGYVFDRNKEKIIDEVLAVYMKAPKTYTAEDVVEIHCHGSIVSLREILQLILSKGSRLAEKGEFTKRAFLNGRLDLAQAESVIDLIKAKSEKTFDLALNQLEGSVSKKVKEIRKLILDELVNITVNIDYPDEDIEQITYENLINRLMSIGDMIEKLVSTAETGRILKEGFKIAIVGKPNVGKSSLMNCLLKEARAIVTEVAGTTRDTIIEDIVIRNIPIKLIDTAGIRDTKDIVEKIGIEKSKEAFNSADLIIFVTDGSKNWEKEDIFIAEKIGTRKAIVLLNKKDKGIILDKNEVVKILKNAIFIETSLIDEMGIEKIEDEIENLVFSGEVSQSNDLFITNVRHKELLEKALVSLKDAISMVKLGEAMEMIEIDVKQAYEDLGEIIGETTSDNIIDEVFARFCLGK